MKTIDNVTTTILDVALRMCGIQLELQIIDKIIDVVKLIEEKGGYANFEDIAKLQDKWKRELESRKSIPPAGEGMAYNETRL